MSISVVVPALIKSKECLDMTIKCINLARSKTSIPFELIIVETESDYLVDYADIHIYEKKASNATISINRGLKSCNTDYVVLLTNDVYLSDNWLECLIECFGIKDCGLATLATTQHNHKKDKKIEEGIWFSVAMIPRMDVYFDEGYVNSWDDSDLIMRIYLDGKKMYRNFNCVVKHLVGKTQYSKRDHESNFIKNRARFVEKYRDHSDHRMYKILTEGILL